MALLRYLALFGILLLSFSVSTINSQSSTNGATPSPSVSQSTGAMMSSTSSPEVSTSPSTAATTSVSVSMASASASTTVTTTMAAASSASLSAVASTSTQSPITSTNAVSSGTSAVIMTSSAEPSSSAATTSMTAAATTVVTTSTSLASTALFSNTMTSVTTTTVTTNPCSSNPCGQNAVCTFTNSIVNCTCNTGYVTSPTSSACIFNAGSYAPVSTTVTFGGFDASAIVSGGTTSAIYNASMVNVSQQVDSALQGGSAAQYYVNGSTQTTSLRNGSLIAQMNSVFNAPPGSSALSSATSAIQSSIQSYYSSNPITLAGQSINAALITTVTQVNICNFLTCPSGTYCSSSTAMCLCNSGSMVIGTYPGFSFIQQCEVINNLSLVITLPIFGGLLLIAVIILIVYVRKRDKNRYDLNSEYFRNGNFRSNAYAIGDEHVPGQQRSDRPSIEGAQLVNFNNQSQPNAQNSMSRL